MHLSVHPRWRALPALLLAAACGAQAQDTLIRRDSVKLTGQVTGEAEQSLKLRAGGWELEVPLRSLRLIARAGRAPRLLDAERAEDEAQRLASRGRWAAALEAQAGGIQAVLGALERGELDAAAARAELEVALRRADQLASAANAPRAASDLFAGVVRHPGVCPWTRDLARTCLAGWLRRAGRVRQAEAQEAQLGLVTTWLLAGPFDNERGTGFSRLDPPAREPFAADAHWPGKVRPVAWRAQPVASPIDGVIDLDALFRPDDQALAYAVTWLHADAETPVALRLGSDEAARLWVNRVELCAFDGRRPFRADQDEVGAVLRAGWNEVLLEVADQTGPWAFRLRVTAPQGGPVAGVRVASLEELTTGAPPAPAEGPAATVPVVRALEGCEAAVAADPQDWRAWARLGYLRLLVQDHDRAQHPDRDALLRACQLRPTDPHLRVLLSRALQSDSELSVQKEENPRRMALEEALRLDPQHAEARFLLASYQAGELGGLDAARDLLAPVIAAEPGYWEAGLLYAALEEGLGLQPLAQARRARLIAAASQAVAEGRAERCPEALLESAIEDARERKDGAAELRLRGELCQAEPASGWARMGLARALWQAERGAEALEAAAAATALAPFDVALKTRQAELLAAAGRLDDAAQVLEAALELAPEEGQLIQALAHLADRRGDASAAEQLFARARALDPNDADLRDYLEYRSRHQEQVAPFEQAWTIDTAPLLAKAKAIPLDPRRTHRVLLRQTVVRLQPDGRSSEWNQELIRIESPDGARRLQTYGTGYHSDQRLTFQLGRLFRARGGQEDAPVGTWQDRGGGGEFGRRLSGGVRFPPLEAGDVIEVRYRTDDLVQGFFGDYYGTTVAFQGAVPFDQVRWVLLAPPGKELHFNTPRLEAIGGRQRQVVQPDGIVAHVFEAEGVPAREPEPDQPWDKELLPLVQVSTFADWDAFARWYWGLVAPQHESDPAIRAKVEELCRGATSEEDKIRRVYEFVVTDVRYNAAWEFGVHGFKPYHAPRIFARRFGDCKDKATLINVMLRELGIASHPVLIFGEDERGREDLALPLIGHFNHCISWVDHGPDGMFLDGTAEHHPFGTLPSMDYGATVVVITPEKALVKTIPTPPADENTIRERHRVKLQSGGSGELSSTLEANGSFGVVLRSLLGTEGRRSEVLEPRLGASYTGAHVTEVRCSDLNDLNVPVKVELSVELPRVLQATTSGQQDVREVRSWLFDLLYLRGRKLSGLAADEERHEDVILPLPAGVDETVIYELPDGLRVQSLPAAQKLETSFGTYTRTYEQRGRQLVAHRVLKMESRRIPAAEYEQLRGFLGAVERAEGEHPSLVKEPQ